METKSIKASHELLRVMSDRLPLFFAKRCEEARSDALRLDRLFTYNLLLYALKNSGVDTDNCELLFTKHGKPYLKGQDISFSLSHTEGLVCVALCDREIGVDAQSLDEENARRIASATRRFFGGVCLGSYEIADFTDEVKDGAEYKITASTVSIDVSERGLVFSQKPTRFTSGIDGACRKWCECEALLKLDGGGFSSLSEIGKISDDASVFFNTYRTKDGVLVGVAIATRRGEKI